VIDIKLSDRAVDKVRALLASADPDVAGADAPGRGLRIGVTPGGCAGYSYSLALAAQADPDDLVLTQDGFEVFVHRAMSPLLRGIRIDYVESIASSGFTFDNPNAGDACGCGTSFAATASAEQAVEEEAADLALRRRVEAALDDVRPYLRSEGGDVDVVSVASGTVTLQLTGACGSCSMSTVTLRGVIEKRLFEAVPGVRRVVAQG